MELELNNLKVDGGEGSRGGRVIGHTDRGKPIYESHHSSHTKFDQFEKLTAADVHKDVAKEARGKGDHKRAEHHNKMSKELHKNARVRTRDATWKKHTL